MKIPSKTLKRWADLKQPGDVGQLAALINKSQPIIYRAFSTGKISKIEDFEKINAFFQARHKKIVKLTEQDQD